LQIRQLTPEEKRASGFNPDETVQAIDLTGKDGKRFSIYF
jgi:hypothetical protein